MGCGASHAIKPPTDKAQSADVAAAEAAAQQHAAERHARHLAREQNRQAAPPVGQSWATDLTNDGTCTEPGSQQPRHGRRADRTDHLRVL